MSSTSPTIQTETSKISCRLLKIYSACRTFVFQALMDTYSSECYCYTQNIKYTADLANTWRAEGLVCFAKQSWVSFKLFLFRYLSVMASEEVTISSSMSDG